MADSEPKQSGFIPEGITNPNLQESFSEGGFLKKTLAVVTKAFLPSFITRASPADQIHEAGFNEDLIPLEVANKTMSRYRIASITGPVESFLLGFTMSQFATGGNTTGATFLGLYLAAKCVNLNLEREFKDWLKDAKQRYS